MEAVYCWQPLYDTLEEARHDVRLTHLLRADLLPESYVPRDPCDPGPGEAPLLPCGHPHHAEEPCPLGAREARAYS